VKELGDAALTRHAELVKDLSERRAQGVVTALKLKFPVFKEQNDRFVVQGSGWDKPLDSDALSRRVEISVLSPEAE